MGEDLREKAAATTKLTAPRATSHLLLTPSPQAFQGPRRQGQGLRDAGAVRRRANAAEPGSLCRGWALPPPVTSSLCPPPNSITERTRASMGACWGHRPYHSSAEIREAFKVFDRDGNGFISKQELGTAMRSLGYMPNEVELEVIIQRLDMDGDGQVDFEEFVTLLGPKLSTSGIPEKFHGTDFDTVFWKCDMQKLTVDELKRLLYDTFCEHLSMKDIENIIMTEEESHLGTAEECPVDVETCSNQQIRQTCVRKSLICAFAIAFIISVMLIAANQVLRSGMK
ncbi:PREDICTED: calcium-binding protein 7 [Dipodomys ordii]|uniref:Calcium-binding protein 7 n=1 Tax=Dipodomys ordii TaxID=10020 RepID=A0A1S3F0N6_DIPOR|nr:PREDICTED: calcium-binding protein 7 [Dipodomys ordii]